MASTEAAAARDPGGPPLPPDAGWPILQRLDDMRRAQDDLRRAQDDLRRMLEDLRSDVKALDARIEVRIDSLRNWSLGLLLLAIVGLLAKLLIPGA